MTFPQATQGMILLHASETHSRLGIALNINPEGGDSVAFFFISSAVRHASLVEDGVIHS